MRSEKGKSNSELIMKNEKEARNDKSWQLEVTVSNNSVSQERA